MFIKLSDTQGNALRTNVGHIITYAFDPTNKFTLMVLADNFKFHVSNTPEEIDAKIEKVTTQTVGGGH